MAGGGRIRGQAEALIRLVGEDQVSELIEKVQKNVKNIEKPALDVRAAFTQVGVAAAGITAAVVAMGKAMEDSARRGGIGRAFSGSFGTPQAALAAIKGVTEAFDDASIQAFATKAARLGIELENIKRLLDLSARAAQATGLEVQDVADEILEGIAGRSSGFFEDRLGLAVDFGRTVSEANKEMQKFGRELSTTEEVALIAGTAIDALEGSFGNFESAQAKSLQTMRAWATNMRNEATDATAEFGFQFGRVIGLFETSADRYEQAEDKLKSYDRQLGVLLDANADTSKMMERINQLLSDSAEARQVLLGIMEREPSRLRNITSELDYNTQAVERNVGALGRMIALSAAAQGAAAPLDVENLERITFPDLKPIRVPRRGGRGRKKEDPFAGFGDTALGDAFAFAELNEFGASADLSMPGDEGPLAFRSAEEMERMAEAINSARDAFAALTDTAAGLPQHFQIMSDEITRMTEVLSAAEAAGISQKDAWVKGAPGMMSAGQAIAGSLIKDQKALAAVMAAFETGKALAAIASFNYVGAALHFAAAAQFGLVAGGVIGGGGGSRGGGGRSRAPSVGASSRVSDTGGGTVERHVVINMRGALVTQEGARELDKMIQKEKPSREFVAG